MPDATEALKQQQPPGETHEVVTVAISTGRHMVLSFPVDMTDGELLEMAGWIAVALRAHVTPKRLHLVMANRMPPKPERVV